MRTFLQNTLISSIQRLNYSGTSGTWSEINANVRCYFRPLSTQEASVNNYQWGQAYIICVQYAIDLDTGDKVIIDGQTYTIRGIAPHNRGREPYKRCLALLPEAN